MKKWSGLHSKITLDIKCNDWSNNLCYFKGKLHTKTISYFTRNMRTCSTRNKKKNHPEQNKFKMIFLLLPVYSDKNLFMIILLRQISGCCCWWWKWWWCCCCHHCNWYSDSFLALKQLVCNIKLSVEREEQENS